MVSPLSYLWYRIRYPTKKIFIHEGLGIEARYERCRDAWQSHLIKSKQFIAENIIGKDLNIVILGAGTLLDCDLSLIAHKAKQITLVDIDPRVAARWPKKIANSPIRHVVGDVTGALDRWSDIFSRSENFLNQQFIPTIPNVPQGDVVISLNLQSQFPVLLKEIMREALARFSIKPDEHDNFPLYYEDLWEELSNELQVSHREAVFEAAKSQAIFIFDTDFVYETDGGSEIHPAIIGEMKKPNERWSLFKEEGWEWNIAPKGEVSDEYSVLHRVRGEAWRK